MLLEALLDGQPVEVVVGELAPVRGPPGADVHLGDGLRVLRLGLADPHGDSLPHGWQSGTVSVTGRRRRGRECRVVRELA